MTVVQVRAPAEMRGRALAILIALTSAATPLGLAAGGMAGELAGGHVRAVFSASGILALLLTSALLSRPAVRRFLAGRG